jgi:tetratricopeptide (TPR) repeat protein
MTKRIIFSAFILVTGFNFAQTKELADARANYKMYAYVDAIKTYERIYNNGNKSAEIIGKLANSYYFKADLEKACKFYSEWNDLNVTHDPEFYYRFAQSLKAVKQYEKADVMMKKFNEIKGDDTRAKLALIQKKYLEEIKINNNRFLITNSPINSIYSDYGPAFCEGKIAFCSGRKESHISNNIHEWTGENYTDLYVANSDIQGVLADAKLFSSAVNTKYNESTPVFSKDGNTMYFTRNNFTNKVKGKDDKAACLLKIYKANRVNGKWGNVTSLPFNSDMYNVAHPALSSDEKTLYFSSDMPGTLGLSDIFKVEILENNKYGAPENLGSTVNTEGRETFPFISTENELFFATDGRPGLGGLDVYVSEYNTKTTLYDMPVNVGEPVNSPKDDFAFVINSERIGFMSSNREGGKGGDDIYQIKEVKKITKPCVQMLSGILKETQTKQVIQNVAITFLDADHLVLKNTMTDEYGEFFIGNVSCSQKYYIKIEAAGYNKKEIEVKIANKTGNSNTLITLDKIGNPVLITRKDTSKKKISTKKLISSL